jgi:DNA-directed RNA polymerase sigma subunit (sigma70/sigma32)
MEKINEGGLNFTETEVIILLLRNGMYTLDEVGKLISPESPVSKERIRQVEAKAREKIRQAAAKRNIYLRVTFNDSLK